MEKEKKYNLKKEMRENLKKPIKDIQLAFRGKNTVCLLDFPSDMMLFFDCIKFYVENKYKNENWSVITDRFYKRYLREEDIEIAFEKMKKIEEEFKKLPVDAVDWKPYENKKIKTNLEYKYLNSLYEVFEKYFQAFEKIVKHVLYRKGDVDYKYYNPIMVTIFTLPYGIDYEQIPLSEFDALTENDNPKWFVANTSKKEE